MQKYGANRSTFNSGVCIKESNCIETANDYFGVIEEILIIEYPRLPLKKNSFDLSVIDLIRDLKLGLKFMDATT